MDRLKHIVFLGTDAGSYMNVGELAQRGIRVHTIKGYGDAAVAGHAIALTIEERDKIAPSRFPSLPPSSVSTAHRFGSDWSRADMAGPAAGSAQSRMTRSRLSGPPIIALRKAHAPLCWLPYASCHRVESSRWSPIPRALSRAAFFACFFAFFAAAISSILLTASGHSLPKRLK
jgi:hypothetical protein